MSSRKAVFGGLALFVVLSACGSEAQVSQDSTRPQKVGEPAVGQPAPEPAEGGAALDVFEDSEAGAARESTAGAAAPLALPEIGAKVIKTAEVQVRIAEGDFQEKFSKASLIAERLGGFRQDSSISETKGKVASGTITLRIPSDKFETALAELRGLGKVTREDQTGQDVTTEFVDLEARLRHARSQEAFYLRLMDQAKTVSDLIQIQQQLSQVQLQIEELTGRLEFLRDRTSFATISLRLLEAGLEPSEPKTGLARSWQEALDGFKNVVGGTIVALGWVAPFVLLGVVIAGGLRIWRGRTVKPASP